MFFPLLLTWVIITQVIFNYELFFLFLLKKSVKNTVAKNLADLRPPINLPYGSYDGLIGKLYDYLTEWNNTSLRCISRQQALLQQKETGYANYSVSGAFFLNRHLKILC